MAAVNDEVRLAPRQRAVLRLRAEGFSRNELCDRLGISRNTYHRHLADAYKRLDLPPACYVTGRGDGCLHEAWRRLGWLVPPDD